MKTPSLGLRPYTAPTSNQIGVCSQTRKRHHSDTALVSTKYQTTSSSKLTPLFIDTDTVSSTKSSYFVPITSPITPHHSPNTSLHIDRPTHSPETISLISTPSPQASPNLTHVNTRLKNDALNSHTPSKQQAILTGNNFQQLILVCEQQRARLRGEHHASPQAQVVFPRPNTPWEKTIRTQLPEPIAKILNNWLENDFLGDTNLKEFNHRKYAFRGQYFPRLLISEKGKIWCQQMKEHEVPPSYALASFGHLIAHDIRSKDNSIFAKISNQHKTNPHQRQNSHQRQYLQRLQHTFCLEQPCHEKAHPHMQLIYALAPLPIAVRNHVKEKISNNSQRLADHPDISLTAYCAHIAALLRSNAGRDIIQDIGTSTAPKLSNDAAIAHLEKFISHEAEKGARGSTPLTTFLWKVKVLEIHADKTNDPDTYLHNKRARPAISTYQPTLNRTDMPGPSWRVENTPTAANNQHAHTSPRTSRLHTPYRALMHHKNDITHTQPSHVDSVASTPSHPHIPSHQSTIPIRSTVIRPAPRTTAIPPQAQRLSSNTHTHHAPYIADLFPKMYLSPALDRAAQTAKQISDYQKHIQNILNSPSTK